MLPTYKNDPTNRLSFIWFTAIAFDIFFVYEFCLIYEQHIQRDSYSNL